MAVRPSRRAIVPTVSEDAPFEMHCVPRDEVLPLIAAAGGRLVTTEEEVATPSAVHRRIVDVQVGGAAAADQDLCA